MTDLKPVTKVFISYTHVVPDQSLAYFLVDYLVNRGHRVFVDTNIPVGFEWAAEIKCQIEASDFFVVLLSKDSIRSAMVREEVTLAYRLSKRTERALIILPVRVGFQGELPYDLGAYLNPIQYALWLNHESYESIGEQISSAIESAIALPNPGKSNDEEASTSCIQALAAVTEHLGAPLPSADLRLETGAIKVGSPFYIERSSDSELKKYAVMQDTTTIVKGMRQIGKSSLLARAYAAFPNHERQAFYLDFQLIDQSDLVSLQSLLRYIARKLAKFFKTKIKPHDVWDDEFGPKENLTDFIEDAILMETKSTLLFLFDEADLVFRFPYCKEFFAIVRVWHNQRATKDCWSRLNLIISHSTDPSLWIKDSTQSPFNVGYRITLEEFNASQVSRLNSIHGAPLKTTSEIEALMRLIGGHPFLVRQCLYTLATSGASLSELNKVAANENGPFGDHLRQYLWPLQEDKDLREALQEILRRGGCDDEVHFQRLCSAGLVTGDSRTAASLRCELYSRYFEKHL
jgi:hypothetical protein